MVNKLNRIGFGYDVHKFADTISGQNFIVICGVKIPYKQKLLSNSDGDVGMHALTDAILGSIAAHDIGYYFPPNEAKWQSYASSHFLEFANSKIKEADYQINNIDITIVCEQPKILIYREEMRKTLSNIMQINIDQISVKGKTTEKLGFTGRKEGIAAYAMILVSELIK